jgi:hypothetical protein
MRIHFLILLLSFSAYCNAQRTISVGVTGSLNALQTLNPSIKKFPSVTRIYAPSVFVHYKTQNSFWVGLQYSGQFKNVVITRNKFFQTIQRVEQTIVEHRISLLLGLQKKEAEENHVFPFLGLNFSYLNFNGIWHITTENSFANSYHQGTGKGVIGYNKQSNQKTISIEIGTHYLPNHLHEKNTSLSMGASIRYYPVPIIGKNNPVTFPDFSNQTIEFDKNIRMLELCLFVGYQFNKHLKQ